MNFSMLLYILPAAFVLDLLLGDPAHLPHPVRWMGKAISTLEPVFRKLHTGLTLSGAMFSILLIMCTWLTTYLLVTAANTFHPFAKTGIEILIIYYSISVRSLNDSAMAVYRSLKKGRLEQAKNRLAMIVGRDVDKLNESQIARAAVETVGENLVDGVISPLFFAAIGGAPMAMAYKMINTLDSMVGYKNENYALFGKFSARIDDIANFLQSRLSIFIIAIAAQILNGKGIRSFKIAVSEGANHTSPNAGYPEAGFAGTLGIQLGGPNTYNGHQISKPYIGAYLDKADLEHIKKACDLMMLSSLIWLGILWFTLFFLSN
ncbi:MAG: adenosylcobinamide-phosphate synthase CbiB [Desulfobacteraceae bacterium]|nr:adenosylcobinamide-phosphate synthase CbiB [Desulfobacteraceae bacterium]